MHAVQITKFGAPEALVAAELAAPVAGPGQVLVRLAASSVNRADALLRSGRYHTLPPLPLIPGTEGAGVVAAVGDGVTGFGIDDPVVAWGSPGFYAELAVADATSVVAVPAGVGFETAAALPVAWLTARYCVRELGRVGPGQVVLLHAAASGVGTAALQTAVADGATVIAVIGSADKEALVRKLGAAHVVNRRSEDIVDAVMRITARRGADVVVDLVGGSAFAASLRAAAVGGRVVALANVALEPSTIDTRDFYPKNVSVLGFQFTNRQRLGWDPRPDLTALLAEVAAGRYSVQIDSRFPLADAAASHRRLESAETAGKVILMI